MIPGRILELQTDRGGTVVISDDTQRHLEAHPGIIDLLTEAIIKIKLPTMPQQLQLQVDLGRIVGKSSLLETPQTTATTPFWFAKRQGRLGPSRVIPDIGPAETSVISIIANAITSDRYELVSAWYGGMAPKEPWDPDLADDPLSFQESLNFWSGHALVHNPEVMDEPFETTWEDIIFKL
jgi:hypothetical protein